MPAPNGQAGKPPGLVFTSDEMPGYSRARRGKGFSFHLPDGITLASGKERKRILSLAIPPAYENVWICMKPNGHLQATGIDARRRKQYRYHPDWHGIAADKKFGMLAEFAKSLPAIRSAYRRELAMPDLEKARVIAGIVCLLDTTGYRIGNARYESENRSHGIATLLTRHIRELDDGKIQLKFRGKSGKQHSTEIEDTRLTALLNDLHDLPGKHLFRYEDSAGNPHDIDTGEVNEWIKEHAGGDFSAKQFRTWKATTLCAHELKQSPPGETISMRKEAIRHAIRNTAETLNHTPATCRKFYIHPALLAAYESGQLYKVMNSSAPKLRDSDGSARLYADERRVLKIIVAGIPGSRIRG